MSWGISPNATEKEKIFADYNDSLMGMNSADGLSYHHYSAIYDIGRNLADKEYQQGKVDREKELSELPNEYSEKLWKLAYSRGRAEERKAIFDELYYRLLNNDDEATIEWCQSNLIDDVDDYIEKGGAKVICIDCVRYGDLHSSCTLVRDMKVDDDSPICENFKRKGVQNER